MNRRHLPRGARSRHYFAMKDHKPKRLGTSEYITKLMQCYIYLRTKTIVLLWLNLLQYSTNHNFDSMTLWCFLDKYYRKCSISLNISGQRSALCRPEAQGEHIKLSAVFWNSIWSFSLLIGLLCNVFDMSPVSEYFWGTYWSLRFICEMAECWYFMLHWLCKHVNYPDDDRFCEMCVFWFFFACFCILIFILIHADVLVMNNYQVLLLCNFCPSTSFGLCGFCCGKYVFWKNDLFIFFTWIVLLFSS